MNQSTLPNTIEDVQNTVDIRHLAIDKVGIKAIRHPVIVKDRSGGEQHTVAMFNMYVHSKARTCRVLLKFST
jgi:GTP cyclohydrolase I